MITIYCRKCGNKLEDDAQFCVHCGTPVLSAKPSQEQTAAGEPSVTEPAWKAATAQVQDTLLPFMQRNRILLIIFAVIIVLGIIGLGSYFGSRCAVSGCSEKAEYGDYCIQHVCLEAGCTNRRTSGSNYCYLHQPATYYASVDLEISNVKLESNSSYTVATGTVTNNGSHTYTFVKVKGAFQDSSGTTLDTDWTYAVGSEGLAPGETTSFRMSVDKDYKIKKCSVSILDYD